MIYLKVYKFKGLSEAKIFLEHTKWLLISRRVLVKLVRFWGQQGSFVYESSDLQVTPIPLWLKLQAVSLFLKNVPLARKCLGLVSKLNVWMDQVKTKKISSTEKRKSPAQCYVMYYQRKCSHFLLPCLSLPSYQSLLPWFVLSAVIWFFT